MSCQRWHEQRFHVIVYCAQKLSGNHCGVLWDQSNFFSHFIQFIYIFMSVQLPQNVQTHYNSVQVQRIVVQITDGKRRKRDANLSKNQKNEQTECRPVTATDKEFDANKKIM